MKHRCINCIIPPHMDFLQDLNARHLRHHHDGHSREIRMEVIPIRGASADHYFLILFRPALLPADSAHPERIRKKTGRQSKQQEERTLTDLQHQFQAGREYSQSLLDSSSSLAVSNSSLML